LKTQHKPLEIMTNGITYHLETEEKNYGHNRYNDWISRGAVHGYHDKPHPLMLSKGAKKMDVANLKSAQKSSLLVMNGSDIDSRFTIGFEVEKNSLSRGAVKVYELFCGFERDGSCGYEAVTHVLPLLPASTWRTKVFDMMHKAQRIIDDSYSPSDNRCGGHITMGVEGMTGDEIREAVRKYSGIVYALFRYRFKSQYCRYNARLEKANSWDTPYDERTQFENGWHNKYQVGLAKDNTFEFRLPSKFESVKQMMRRYELMFELLNVSVNKPNTPYKTFLKNIRPLIVSMYEGDEAKADKVIAISYEMQDFITNGRDSDTIRKFVRAH